MVGVDGIEGGRVSQGGKGTGGGQVMSQVH